MRKHFLLLMLLTLLPFYGWAATDVTVTLYDFTITYGDAEPTVATLPGDACKVEGADLNDIAQYLTFTRDAGSNVGVYNWTLTKAANTGEYTIYLSSNNAKMTIAKATTNSWDTPAAVIAGLAQYDGTPKNLLQTEGVAKHGTPVYSIDGGATWNSGMPTATNSGVYTVKIKVVGNDNYVGIDESTVGNATINGNTITEYTAPQAITGLKFNNGPQNLVTAGSATGGTVMYKLGEGEWKEDIPQGTTVGSYTVSWKVKGDANYNDKEAEAVGEITIGKGDIEITNPEVVSSLSYTGVGQEVITNPGSANLGANVTYCLQKQTAPETWTPVSYNATASNIKVTNAGTYRVQTFVSETSNYDAAYNYTEPFTVAKVPLTVSTKGCSKIYGDADPTFEVVYNGFVNNETADDLETKAVVTREAGSDAGYYALSFSTQAADGDYEISHSTTVNYLLINPKPLVATGTGAVNITFGEHPVYNGSAKEANITSVSFDGGAKTAYVPATGVGDYVVSYDGTTNINAGDEAKVIITGKNNYTGSVEKTFTIDKAPIYVWPEVAEKTYGDPDPASFTWHLGDEAGVENNSASLVNSPVLSRVPGENVGTYKIYLSAYEAAATDNYAVQNVNDQTTRIALFTINAKEGNVLNLKFKSTAIASKTYGNENPVWTMDDLETEEVSGLIGDDEWAVVKNNIGTPVFTVEGDGQAGPTTVTVSGLGSPNYPTVTVTPLVFNIEQRPITVTVGDQTIAYGTALGQVYGTNWNITNGTLAPGEGAAVLGLTVETVNPQATYAVSDEDYENVITAAITNTNYNMTVLNGDLTVNAVNPAVGITLTRNDDMDALIKAYDGEDTKVTLDRNISRTEAWFAMVLPFETTVTELSSKYGYAVVNVLDEGNTDASKVKFKLHMQTIAANQPFLIKIATAKETPMDFGSKPIVYAADPMRKDAAGNEFHGVFKTTKLAVSDYLWTMIPAQNSFKKLDQSGTTLTPINAYLKTKENLDAFAPTIFVEDFDFNSNTTAIKALNLENMKAYNVDGWYNLNGVKLQGVPTEKGIYINNGKKVVIK